MTTVTLTMEFGLAIWHVTPEDATIGDLAVAHERKVFRGDPLRPYLLVDEKWGMAGPTPGGWDNFLFIWESLIYASGSWQVLKRMVTISQSTWELLERATKHWRRHRDAAAYTRQSFEERGADIIDVIDTAQVAATYQLADLMAWTGIDNPAVAADVAGWAGYGMDDSTQELSPIHDENLRQMVYGVPVSLSIEDLSISDLGASQEEAHAEVMAALAEVLLERGLAEEL